MTPVLKLLPIAIANNLGREGGGGGGGGLPYMGGDCCPMWTSNNLMESLGLSEGVCVAFGGGASLHLEGVRVAFGGGARCIRKGCTWHLEGTHRAIGGGAPRI